MIGSWLRRRYTGRMEEDSNAVKDKVAVLKKADKGNWDSVEGFHMMPSVVFGAGSQTIEMDKGVTFKLFINIDTNEIKMFYYKEFIKD